MEAPRRRDDLHLVPLDADHPGFRDREYRRRRDAIARIALEHRPGDPVPRAPYTADEQAVWTTIWRRLGPLHLERACRELNELQASLNLGGGPIAQLADLNAFIEPRTGYRMEPVAGLVSAREFFLALGRGVFLSTQYIRHASRPFYTPEPDIVHEAVGHAATLADPRIAGVNRAFGAAAERADGRNDEDELEHLNRAYWYTMEFGTAREGGRPKAFGAGLLSSVGEITLQHAEAIEPWDLDRIASTPYDPTRYQPRLFAAPSVERLLGDLEDWLAAR